MESIANVNSAAVLSQNMIAIKNIATNPKNVINKKPPKRAVFFGFITNATLMHFLLARIEKK